MMQPYYLLDFNAPLSVMFEAVGWKWASYIVNIGALCALIAGLVGTLYPMPRIVLAMGRDGVIFRCFSYVSPTKHTPMAATLFTGVLTGKVEEINFIQDRKFTSIFRVNGPYI